MSLLQNEAYLGNPNVKRDGVLQVWTPELLQIYKKCMDDPIYFAEKYEKFPSPRNAFGLEVVHPFS